VRRIVRKLLHPIASGEFAACAYDTPRSWISRTASSLNSRVNFRLSMTHLLLHKTPNSVSSEPGAAQFDFTECYDSMVKNSGKSFEWTRTEVTDLAD
jgi:hypothetical protein